MSNYTLESFITFCDDMQISNESFNFKSILSKIQNVFSKLVLMIESKVKKMKDSKLKSILLRLLSRAKNGLSKCKSLREYNPDMIDRLTQEAEEIKEEYEEVVKEESKKDNNVDNSDDEKSNDDKIYYQDDGKTIWYIKKPDGTMTVYQDDGKTIFCIKKPDGTKTFYRDDGKTIWYIEKPDGTDTHYQDDGKTIWYIEKPDGTIINK